MARVVYSAEAFSDLQRVADFEKESSADPAEAIERILECVELLERHPEIGRPVARGYRELVISRGRTGYAALYHFDPRLEAVRVLRVRHQREAGYRH